MASTERPIEKASSASATSRPRAPTIQIDTSNVERPVEEPPHALGVPIVPSPPNANLSLTTSQLHGESNASFPSTESTLNTANGHMLPTFDPNRPTSPHNVSSPVQGFPSDFDRLAVPAHRSRGDSFHSADSTFASSTPTLKEPEVDNGFITHDEDALRPDPGQEGSFRFENDRFPFSAGQLNKMMNPKNLAAFYALGGPAGLEKGLRTSLDSGLSQDEHDLDGKLTFADVTDSEAPQYDLDAMVAEHHGELDEKSMTKKERKQYNKEQKEKALPKIPPQQLPKDGRFKDRIQAYRDNRLPVKKPKNIFQLAWIAYNDKILILLTAAAIISLAVGLYQTFDADQHQANEPRIEWVEGVAIIVAIVIVVAVGALNDFQKERQFVKLNRKKEDRVVKVIRSGRSEEISVYDVLVGDVMHLEPGDLIPVDGIFIKGHNMKCDEASATGESDLLRKTAASEVYKAIQEDRNTRKMDPFILSGSKVAEGVGTFLVTSVGVNSSNGKTMMSLRDEIEATPLQAKLNTMAEYIAKLGGAAALLLFIVMFLKFVVQLKNNTGTSAQKGQQFLNILIITITLVVVAVPEGLPLAVTLTLAFATTRMMKEHNLVRLLRSCETMGNATSICSDKTGTLTQNVMTVVAGLFGTSARFGDAPLAGKRGTTEIKSDEAGVVEDTSASAGIRTCVGSLHADVKSIMEQSIVINSTAFEGEVEGQKTFIGSKTETALLSFAREFLGTRSVQEERSNAVVVQLVPFDSARKCMAAAVRLPDGRYRLYIKGASEILLSRCTSYLKDPTVGLSSIQIDRHALNTITNTITAYANRSLRTIALVYRDFESWPPKNCQTLQDDPSQVKFEDVFKHLTFLSVVGIQDPLRPGVAQAVKDCQMAGVTVRMVTGDNVLTAKAIAAECGIYNEKAGGRVMEGPEFRLLPKVEMDKVIPRLQVLARSSPEDKRILVKRLKELGETVAVTGDGTNDAPALKTADVGFSMGIAGTEVAKEASAIILMDDNFSSIVKALMWGRAVNDSVKKFLQFQLTVNITAVFLTFISAVSSDQEQSVLTAVQLLWVNLIMDTFAALALATDPPQLSILNRRPDPKSAPLVTLNMWKMMIGQAAFQLAVTLILYYKAEDIFNYERGDRDANGQSDVDRIATLVFNTFVWMQIFNQYNCRRLDNKFNIFEGVFKNPFFIVINVIMVGGQVLIIFKGDAAFSVKALTATQWAISILLGFLGILWGIVLRLIPEELIRHVIPASIRNRAHRHKNSDEETHSDYHWNPAMVEIKEELGFLRSVRGGRLNQLKFALRHPREALQRSRNSSNPGTPSPRPSTDGLQNALDHSPSGQRTRKRGRSNSSFGPAAAMAGIVAGSIAGFSPIEKLSSDGGKERQPSRSGAQGLSPLSKEVVDSPTASPPQMMITQPSEPSEEPSRAGTPPTRAATHAGSEPDHPGLSSAVHQLPAQHEETVENAGRSTAAQ